MKTFTSKVFTLSIVTFLICFHVNFSRIILYQIQDIPGIWTWVQQHFIPAIYAQQWYNGNNFTNFKMLQNQEVYRIGLARIRQLRIKPGIRKFTVYFHLYYSLFKDSSNSIRSKGNSFNGAMNSRNLIIFCTNIEFIKGNNKPLVKRDSFFQKSCRL